MLSFPLVPLVLLGELLVALADLRGLQKWRRNFTRKLTIPVPFPPHILCILM